MANPRDILKDVKTRATDYSGSKTRKVSKGILGVIIVILLGALGLEATNNDWDIGKILKGEPSKVLRDKEGNVVNDSSQGKATDEYNCPDFSGRDQAQRFFSKAGGPSQDTNRLDGDNDSVACEDLRTQPAQ
ncbi:MAG: excalibur calcium-binding domain-containing protein [bacterium]|nr:excalibur calcium-binding domain-containing protein [bacterium]